ncbi:phenylacetate--CoA ligase family protein [Actinoplanes sp. NPDC051513]|uniref:phenylacetate--CoA ligase family protein n=1 Tax=Actinoplanes sp. NPDC051513 TaxID=3363908 RepID=UPI00378E0DC2
MSFLSLWNDARKAVRQGRPGIKRRQRQRLAAAVTQARTHSRFYRELYEGLPDQVSEPHLLPITDKRQLMAHFDDWVSDPRVTLEQARAFADNPSLVGAPFLDTYLLTTTSGTSGDVAIFLHDRHTLAVAAALSVRAVLSGGGITPRILLKALTKGGRSAKIVGTGGHFAAVAAEMSQQRTHPRREKKVRLFSVQTPLPQLVAQLNEFRPALLECYASTGLLLAAEREARRLHIDPTLISLGGEGLPEAEYGRISTAFGGARIFNLYACNEAVALSFACREGWLHIHEDWIVFEPVNADYTPTLPGQLSHTVLLSTLYKREQPILRYDLGDSVLRRPDPCPCGSPFMAVRLQGRSAEALTFTTEKAERVSIVPLALATTVERTTGVELFQLVQSTPDTLQVRLRAAEGADPLRVREAVHTDLAELLSEHQLAHVTIEATNEPPAQTSGGKYPQIIPYT